MSNIEIKRMARIEKPTHRTRVRGKTADGRDFIQKVGHNLFMQRKRLGLSQADVAEQVGLEPESISRIENGLIAPTLSRLQQFGRVYGCSLIDLLGEASSLPRDLDNRLASVLTQLNETDRTFVTEHAIALARHLGAASPSSQSKKVGL